MENKNMYRIFRSRKFWAAVIGLLYSLVYLVWPDFPIPEESVLGVVGTLVSYILGTALEDGMSKKQDAVSVFYVNGEDNGND